MSSLNAPSSLTPSENKTILFLCELETMKGKNNQYFFVISIELP